ncbi:hypothetical protein LINPERHAP1_LOCUS16777, partial [Linum perenne]
LLCFLSIDATQGGRTGYGRVSEVNRRRIRLSDGFSTVLVTDKQWRRSNRSLE